MSSASARVASSRAAHSLASSVPWRSSRAAWPIWLESAGASAQRALSSRVEGSCPSAAATSWRGSARKTWRAPWPQRYAPASRGAHRLRAPGPLRG